jgi:prepilin peptidase CpaA
VLDDPFKYGLLAGLAIALLVAAFTDLRSRTIGNGLNAAIALGAPLFWWATGVDLWPDAVLRIATALVAFAVLAATFARGGMGGGDVKLVTAIALWMPPLVFLVMAFIASLVGGAMSMVAAARNLKAEVRGTAKAKVAVAGSALWVLGACYFAWAVSGGPTLQPTAVFEDFVPLWAARTMAAILVVALLAGAAVSAIVTSRNQASRLAVPYGVAISTGALLIVLAQFAPLVRPAVVGGGLG